MSGLTVEASHELIEDAVRRIALHAGHVAAFEKAAALAQLSGTYVGFDAHHWANLAELAEQCQTDAERDLDEYESGRDDYGRPACPIHGYDCEAWV